MARSLTAGPPPRAGAVVMAAHSLINDDVTKGFDAIVAIVARAPGVIAGCRIAREAADRQAGRSAAAKRSMIAAAGSTVSIVPTLWPAYIAIASTSPLVAESGMLSA